MKFSIELDKMQAKLETNDLDALAFLDICKRIVGSLQVMAESKDNSSSSPISDELENEEVVILRIAKELSQKILGIKECILKIPEMSITFFIENEDVKKSFTDDIIAGFKTFHLEVKFEVRSE